MTNLLSSVRVEPYEPARSTVIWLHGLGANGYDFQHVIEEMQLPHDTAVRLVCPHAPQRPITINRDQVMRAWFDIRSLEWLQASDVDTHGIRDSISLIDALIRHEQSLGIPPERIILAGFSQGGVIALHAATRYPEKLGGVIALSTCLPMHLEMADQISPANKNISAFMAHGTMDPMIPIEVGRESCTALRGILPNVEWREYPVEHHVSPDEIVDIRRWLQNLPAVC